MAAGLPNENAGGDPSGVLTCLMLQTVRFRLLIVVEAALAWLVVALAARAIGTGVTTRRTTEVATGPATAVEAAGRRGRAAGEVGASVAHRTAVAGAAVATAAAAALAATTTVAAATAAAAIAAATAAAVAATTAASAVRRTRTARTEAAAVTTAAAATAEATAATTAGLALDGFADGNRTSIKQRAVHGLHGRGALIIGFHLEEREAAAAAGLAIHDHF